MIAYRKMFKLPAWSPRKWHTTATHKSILNDIQNQQNDRDIVKHTCISRDFGEPNCWARSRDFGLNEIVVGSRVMEIHDEELLRSSSHEYREWGPVTLRGSESLFSSSQPSGKKKRYVWEWIVENHNIYPPSIFEDAWRFWRSSPQLCWSLRECWVPRQGSPRLNQNGRKIEEGQRRGVK